MGCFPHGLVVNNAVANHVDTHISGGLIGAIAQDLIEHGDQNGEGLYIPIVVYGGHTVSLQVEGIDHVYVVEVGGCGLIGQVDRMI